MRLHRSNRRRVVGKSLIDLSCPGRKDPFLSSRSISRQKFSPLHPTSIPSHPIASLPPHLILPSPLCAYSTITITIQFNSIQFNTITIFYPAQICCKVRSVQFHSIACSGARWPRCLSTPVHHSSDKLPGSPSVWFVSCPATSPCLI